MSHEGILAKFFFFGAVATSYLRIFKNSENMFKRTTTSTTSNCTSTSSYSKNTENVEASDTANSKSSCTGGTLIEEYHHPVMTRQETPRETSAELLGFVLGIPKWGIRK